MKLLVQYLETWAKRLPSETRADTVRKFCAKMAPPLVSLIRCGGPPPSIRSAFTLGVRTKAWEVWWPIIIAGRSECSDGTMPPWLHHPPPI